MNKTELQQTINSFNSRIEQEQEPLKLFNLFERCYNWLVTQINLEQEDIELQVELINSFYQSLYNIGNVLRRKKIKAKDNSNSWNSSLVAKTYKISKESSSKQVKELLHELQEETDFPTKAYCYQVLQQDSVVDFSKMIVTKKQLMAVKRPSIVGNSIKDDNSLYEHRLTGELMTYDQCTEKGLDHTLLTYPTGHELQHLYVGFKELDETKIAKVPISNETVEWVEETLMD